MDAANWFNHSINFLAPALWLALLLPLLARLIFGAKPAKLRLSWQFAIQFAVGSSVLSAGLALFGNDAKMLSYLALVLANASAQWFMLPGQKNPRGR